MVVAPFGRVVDSEDVATPASKNPARDSGGEKFGELGSGGSLTYSGARLSRGRNVAPAHDAGEDALLQLGNSQGLADHQAAREREHQNQRVQNQAQFD